MRGGTGHHTPVPTPSHVGGVAQPPPSSLPQFPPLQRGSTAGPPATRPVRVTEAKRSRREPSTRPHSFVTVI